MISARARTLTTLPWIAAALIACGGGGGNDGERGFAPPPPPLPTPTVAKYLYVPNRGSNNVSAFAINAATGSLSPVSGSPFAAGDAPRTATANRAGSALYVVNEGSPSAPPRISAYAINNATGALTAVSGSPFDLSTPPPPPQLTPTGSTVVHPLGTLVYTSVAGTGTLFGATVGSASGALTPIVNGPATVGLGLGTGRFNASGNILYLPHDSHNGGAAGGITMYSVHPTSGIPDLIGSIETGGRVPANLTLNAQGTLLFAPNAGSGTVAVMRVDTSSGTLTPAAGSPFNAGGDTIPVSIVLHPSKNFAYTTNAFVYSDPSTSTLSGFRFDPATGEMTPIPGSPFTTSGGSATGARIDPSGKFLYVSNLFDDNIKAYAIDQTTGALTNIPGSPFATGLSPSTVEIDPSGKYLYVANTESHTVSSYAINESTGALTLISSVPTGTGPQFVEMVGLQ